MASSVQYPNHSGRFLLSKYNFNPSVDLLERGQNIGRNRKENQEAHFHVPAAMQQQSQFSVMNVEGSVMSMGQHQHQHKIRDDNEQDSYLPPDRRPDEQTFHNQGRLNHNNLTIRPIKIPTQALFQQPKVIAPTSNIGIIGNGSSLCYLEDLAVKNDMESHERCSDSIDCKSDLDFSYMSFTQSIDTFCYLKTPGLYHHPYMSSQKYIWCTNNQTFEISCPFGMNFDHNVCVPELFGQCNQVGVKDVMTSKGQQKLTKRHYRIKCPPKVLGLFPHPFSNALYIKCVKGVQYIKQCRQGQVFSMHQKYCDTKNHINNFELAVPIDLEYPHGDVVQNNNTSIQCHMGLDGKFIYPFTNRKYVTCSNGVTNIEKCMDGSVYNSWKGRCMPCKQNTGRSKRNYIPEESSNDDKKFGVICGPNSEGQYPHPNDWQKFVKCFNGIVSVQKCPRNTIFDLEFAKCRTI
ncbi:uncharacterized protein LOC142234929 [Haematobia irritans]|uniref:uncharacterized protein LOC142234929 n=1 Tax=Haematobia irritans TaxID=7368 RepID=UPI003F50660C